MPIQTHPTSKSQKCIIWYKNTDYCYQYANSIKEPILFTSEFIVKKE